MLRIAPTLFAFLFASFLMLSVMFVAHAVVLDWHKVEGGRIRLSFATSEQGGYSSSIVGLIEVELEEGWKTYWKNPGPSGMAPKLMVEDREGTILFPFPSLIKGKTADDWSFGYQDRVTFPFISSRPDREKNDVKEISGALHIGICKDICIPVLIDFHLPTQSLLDAIVVGRYEAVRDSFDQPVDEQFGYVTGVKKVGKHFILRVSVPEEEGIPQLFVYTDGVDFGLPEFVSATGGAHLYTVPILSGLLEKKAHVEYVVVGKTRTVAGGIILNSF